MTAGRLLFVLLALIPGACAQPDVLSRPAPAPTMPLPAGSALPLPPYAQRTGEDPASVALDQTRPEPAFPSPHASAESGEWLGEWLASDPRAPRAGTFRRSEQRVLGPQGLVAGRAGNLYTRPDGGWTRRDNEVFLHSDGSSTVRMGDVFFHSDGTWARRSGGVILRSDGTSCRLSADTATCP